METRRKKLPPKTYLVSYYKDNHTSKTLSRTIAGVTIGTFGFESDPLFVIYDEYGGVSFAIPHHRLESCTAINITPLPPPSDE